MAGAAHQGRVTDEAYEAQGLVYRLAGPEDEAELRGLLRGNPLAGWVALSLEREPDYFAPLLRGEEHETIICRDRDSGATVGMCARSVRPAYVDGAVRPLGYLGELRVAPAYRNRLKVVRNGFAAVKALLHEPQRTPYYVTSIVSDNRPARRLLEAGLPGLPVYRPYAEMTTLALGTATGRRAQHVERGGADDLRAIAACLARNHRRRQFAAVWTERDLARAASCGGPGPEDFLVLRRGGGIAGCLALWDQSSQRQVVVRGYDPRLRRVRSLVNLLTPLTGLPYLPKVGEPLRQVYLSHAAVDDDDPQVLVRLVAAALQEARRRGSTLALLGMARRDPMFAAVSAAFRARRYDNQLYLVHWPEGAAAAESLDDRLPHLEIGLL